MPKRPKSICRHRGCGALIDAPGYCPKHKQEGIGWNRHHGDKTAEERGYGPKWKKARARILRRDKGICQCEDCKKNSWVRPATEVDHVVNKAKARTLGWTEDQIEADGNLQAINEDCHKRKTSRERNFQQG